MGNPVVHFDIGCDDLEQSRAFYTELFDWTSESYGPMSFSLNTGASQGIHGATTALGHEPKQYVMFYVEVDDIDAKLAEIEALGGQTVIPATPAPGDNPFAWFTDPAGNLVGLWQSAKPASQ